MRYISAKERKKRLLFVKNESMFLVLKTLAKTKLPASKRLRKSLRARPNAGFRSFFANGFFSRLTNRCLITGRAHGIMSFFKLSRLQMRDMYGRGYFYGVKKSSW
jgi:ribosomal protein S14